MSYCLETQTLNGLRYYCDWKDLYYLDYRSCYLDCFTVNGQVIPVSQSDFYLLMGLTGILCGFLLALTFLIASN